ncbi:hypothetical protein SAMN05428944_7468 [Streptomyces sp. 1222.5]|uniref:hypothetical protein n=1 Tax=unclassified Streptomyces TaxID=2593676 RepID=UPI000896E66A|nr:MULTISPECIES: hypothetical protein [unclassified Streptomyces]PKW05507.1 hypothetical protein BX260_0623 [Streptomyces sp. 5112.2]SED37304.1 hypothetical protein SAMN05428944_7468 [Streptomyces sp. 1222.5]
MAAIRFTDWYPKVVRARVLREHGEPVAEEPRLSGLLLPLAGLLVPVGIAVLVLEDTWGGLSLIVLGSVLARTLRDRAAHPVGAGGAVA